MKLNEKWNHQIASQPTISYRQMICLFSIYKMYFCFVSSLSKSLPILCVSFPSPRLSLCFPLCIFVHVCVFVYLYAGAQSAALGPWPPDIEDTCATAPELHHNIQATENTTTPNHGNSHSHIKTLQCQTITRYSRYLPNSKLSYTRKLYFFTKLQREAPRSSTSTTDALQFSITFHCAICIWPCCMPNSS